MERSAATVCRRRYLRSSKVRLGNGSEPLLTRRVPNLDACSHTHTHVSQYLPTTNKEQGTRNNKQQTTPPPHLQLDALAVQFNVFDFEVDAYCGDEGGGEGLVGVPQQQRRLPDTWQTHNINTHDTQHQHQQNAFAYTHTHAHNRTVTVSTLQYRSVQ